MADWFTPNYDWFKSEDWTSGPVGGGVRQSAKSAEFDVKRNDYELGKGLEVLRVFGEEPAMTTIMGGENLTFAQQVQAGGKQPMIWLVLALFVFFWFVMQRQKG